MKGYQCGLVSVSFREYSAEEILNAMKSVGLTCIEWGSDIHAPCHDTVQLEKLVSLQERYGIACCSYGTYFRLGENDVNELLDYITAAKKLGTKILRLWCGAKGSGQYTAEEREALFLQCRTAAAMAKEHDVILCMECHNHTFTDTKEGALALMQAVDSPNFRMYWQPNQYKTEEENLRYAELLSLYTCHLHVFHWKGDNRYPLSDGVKIWQNYLERFDGERTLLLEFMPDHKIESLLAETAALMKLAGKV